MSKKKMLKLFIIKLLALSCIILVACENIIRGYIYWLIHNPRGAVWLSWSEDPCTTMTINWFWDIEDKAYVLYWNATYRGFVETHEPSRLFHVVLHGLSPGTKYHYVIGYYRGSKMVNWSDILWFRTAPRDVREFTVLIHSDTHAPGYGAFEEFIESAQREDFDFIIHCGDMVDRGTEFHWNSFLKTEEAIAKNYPLMTVIGNHEIMYGGKEYYPKFMCLPNRGYWYYFQYSNAMFIILNVSDYEHFVFPKEEEEMFIKAMEYAESNNLWRIVIFHVPVTLFFPSKIHPDAPRRLIPLLNKYKPHMVIMGHSHAYGRKIINGTLYVIVGPSGGFPNMIVYDDNMPDKYEFESGYILLRVSDEEIVLTYKSVDGDVLDIYKIKRR